MVKHLEPVLGSRLFAELYAPKRVGIKGWDIPLETPSRVIKNENGSGFSIITNGMRMNLETEHQFYSDEPLEGEVVFEGNLKEAYNFTADFYPNKIKRID